MRLLARKPILSAMATGLAAIALCAALLLSLAWVGFGLAVAALAQAWWTGRGGRLAEQVFSRGIAATALTVSAVLTAPEAAWPAALAGAALVGIIGLEHILAAAIATSHLESVRLEVSRAGRGRRFTPAAARVAIDLATALLVLASGAVIATGAPVPAWVAFGGVALVSVYIADGAAAAWRARRGSVRSGDAEVLAAVEQLAPRFLVHLSGPSGTAYQLRMWLPYLDSLEDPYLIVVRQREHLDDLRDDTEAPIVAVPGIAEVERLLVPSVGAVLYVNNSAQNTQLVRFTRLTHVQLFHGESDKASSFNPVTAVYDRILVAGQAAVDRYGERGIDIPERKFRLIGRPQLADVTVGERPDRGEEPTLLYAPTWTGLADDFDYSSLSIGKSIVAEALERGVTVILRAHPFTHTNMAAADRLAEIERLLADDRRRTGRAHIWGREAAESMSLVDCVNAADAAVTDVSAVATDWIESDRPFAVCDMGRDGEYFSERFWIARGAYHIDSEATNLDLVFDELFEKDSKSLERAQTRSYFLGDERPGPERLLWAIRDAYGA